MSAQLKDGNEPRFYDCGICGCYHPYEWDGDCRDDANRYTIDQLDDRFGPFGWEELPMPGTENDK